MSGGKGGDVLAIYTSFQHTFYKSINLHSKTSSTAEGLNKAPKTETGITMCAKFLYGNKKYIKGSR